MLPVVFIVSPISFAWFALELPTARGVLRALFLPMLVGNMVQLAALVVCWLVEQRRRPKDPETAFWGEVLKRYWIIGAVAYHLYARRVVQDPAATGHARSAWLRFLRSPWSAVLLRLNRVWYPVFVVELVVSAAIGLFQVDALVRPWFVLVGVTATAGLATTTYVLLVALGDAVTRAAGSADDQEVASEIVSSLYAPRSVKAYIEAASGDTAGR